MQTARPALRLDGTPFRALDQSVARRIPAARTMPAAKLAAGSRGAAVIANQRVAEGCVSKRMALTGLRRMDLLALPDPPMGGGFALPGSREWLRREPSALLRTRQLPSVTALDRAAGAPVEHSIMASSVEPRSIAPLAMPVGVDMRLPVPPGPCDAGMLPPTWGSLSPAPDPRSTLSMPRRELIPLAALFGLEEPGQSAVAPAPGGLAAQLSVRRLDACANWPMAEQGVLFMAAQAAICAQWPALSEREPRFDRARTAAGRPASSVLFLAEPGLLPDSFLPAQGGVARTARAEGLLSIIISAGPSLGRTCLGVLGRADAAPLGVSSAETRGQARVHDIHEQPGRSVRLLPPLSPIEFRFVLPRSERAATASRSLDLKF
jgi:hypothetical protein